MKNLYKKLFTLTAALIWAGSSVAQVELVTDGGFEAGPGSGAWTEASTNFGTPICDLSCGNGSGTGPATGAYWAWFGGAQGVVETGSVSQSFVIPSGGTAILTFKLEQIVCDGPQDFLEIQVDGNVVFSSDGTSPLCNVLGYSTQIVDISAYADGNNHTLEFVSTTFSANGNITNFFVDDISVMHSGGGTPCPNIIADGDLELGPGSGTWTETSTNFGTPICDVGNCGTGSGTGPNGGTYWAWFGGYAGGTETGSLSQSFVFPAGDSISLEFYLEQIVCDGPTDFLEILVDNIQVFLTDGTSPLCGVLGYSLQTVDLSAFADGNSHTLTFNSTTFSVNGTETNFFVDDISVFSCPSTPVGNACGDTTTFGGLSVAIPDDDTTGVTDTQVISGVTGTLGVDVQLKSVCFQVDHTWVGDLIIRLIAPNGSQITLTDRPGVPATLVGCDGDNIDVCVDVGVGNEMENVCSNLPAIAGSYTAANGQNLGDVNNLGGSPNGNWQLFLSDNVGSDTGTLLEWALVFDNGPIANWTSPGILCASAGSIDLDTLVTGTPGGTWTGSGVTGSTFDPTGLSGGISITYTVTDTSGCSDSETNIITVAGAPPVSSFTFFPASLTAIFTNTSTGATSYLWDFGDGNTSTLENPSHTYAAAGTYTVTLTVTNACGNNVSTQTVIVQICPDIIVDGGFEAGPGSGAWIETSTNFGTPLCDLGCGVGGGTGPRTGNYWSWFGGIASFEEGTISQDITILVNSTANLSFWIEMANCDGPDDFLKIAVDADTVYSIDGGNALCGTIGYTLQVVNLDAYDDGLPHTLTFISRVYGTNGNVTNFFVDDIALNVCTFIGVPENNLNQQVSVMPVPARDFVTVNFKDIVAQNVKIEITDIVGKSILNKTIDQVNDDQSERIDVSGWNKGVYMLKVTAGTNSVIRKIVVQ